MAFLSPPLNPDEEMVRKDRKPSKTFIDLWTAMQADADAAPARLGSAAERTDEGAAVTTTPLGTPDTNGLYQVAWHLRITTPAGVSSSAQVTFSWTERGTTQTYVGTNVNGNTTTSHESAPPITIRADAATPITYAIAYASNPADVMRFSFDAFVSQVAA